MKTIEEILYNKDNLLLVWQEPRCAIDASGVEYTANVKLSTTVQEGIDIQRKRSLERGIKDVSSDGDQLFEFMTIHWASTYTNDESREISRLLTKIKKLEDTIEELDENNCRMSRKVRNMEAEEEERTNYKLS